MPLVTVAEVDEAQRAWGEGLVGIGAAFAGGLDHREVARRMIADRYAFDFGTVLFKPTRCNMRPFRGTPRAALSYFVGGDPEFPEDLGFARSPRPYIAVRFANTGVIEGDDHALAMGHYYFRDSEGRFTKVEYTFGYRRLGGHLRINLHHSSLPFPGMTDV